MKGLSFDKFLSERAESAGHREAVKLGLEYKGGGYWKNPQTGRISHQTVDGELVPYNGPPAIEADAGGPINPATLADKNPQQADQMAPPLGAGVGPAPEPGEEQPNPMGANWSPGPDGDNCVEGQPPPKDLSFDMFVGKTNYYKWVAGSDGSNYKNLNFNDFTQDDVNEEVLTEEEMDAGNPTSAMSGLTPSAKAQQLGLISNGHGGYLDQSGQLVARTINGELVFYDGGVGGGAVSDGAGGQAVATSQPSWQEPTTGQLMVPPAHPESPEEIAAIPDPIPAVAPTGYDKFMNQRALEVKKDRILQDEIQAKDDEVNRKYMGHPMTRAFKIRVDNIIGDAATSQDPQEKLFAAHMKDVVDEYSDIFHMVISNTEDEKSQLKVMATLSAQAQQDALSRSQGIQESKQLSYDLFLNEDFDMSPFEGMSPNERAKIMKLLAGARKSKDQGKGLYDSIVQSYQKKQAQQQNPEPVVQPNQSSAPTTEIDNPNPQNPGKPDLDTLLSKVRSGLDVIQDVGGKMSQNDDELGDALVSASDSGNLGDVLSTIKQIKDRNAGQVGNEGDIYNVTSAGGLGSDRGRYVEQGLTDHVLPQIFDGQGLEFMNDGGPRVKTDVRSTFNGEDRHRYTVKSTVGTDGLEANNAGFRRFFDMWNLDPQSGPGKMFSHLMGFPLDWAQQQGFGDNLGLWDDKRDGLNRDGLVARRKTPLQLMYPGMNFSPEELNANSMLPKTLQRLFPQEHKEGMEWLMDNREEIARRIISQRDNDFGENGAADPNARPNIDFDPNPVDRAAWYHLDKGSRGSPKLKGKLDIHDVSPEQVKKVLKNSQWNLSDSISGGLSLDTPFEGRGGKRSLLTLTRKANKAGGGRYGNGFHSPRFGYKHNSFDMFPHVSSTPVEMTMGAKQKQPLFKKDGSPQMDRQGNAKSKIVDGKILPNSVKIGKTKWGDGYSPST